MSYLFVESQIDPFAGGRKKDVNVFPKNPFRITFLQDAIIILTAPARLRLFCNKDSENVHLDSRIISNYTELDTCDRWIKPVRTQRCFDVYTTFTPLVRRCVNVETTSWSRHTTKWFNTHTTQTDSVIVKFVGHCPWNSEDWTNVCTTEKTNVSPLNHGHQPPPLNAHRQMSALWTRLQQKLSRPSLSGLLH